MSHDPLKVILAGGGTGGHVIPAIALADELASRGAEVGFIGTKGRLEERLVPEAGFEIAYINVRPLAGKGVLDRGLGLLSVPASVLRSLLLLRKERPDVVMGVGGYVAGPVVLAAALLDIPTALLEQNATLGLTNRLLARWVGRAFVSYESLLDVFPPSVGMLTGNPVKASIVEAAEKKKRRRKGAPLRLLVMGGSQGASAIDERVPRALADAEIRDAVKVLHQCGEARLGAVKSAYDDAGIAAEVVTFITDTAKAYTDADLVVARSGATTVSELTVMGMPAVLLPYPHHADRQQEKNAEPMRKAGAAVVLDEKNTDVAALAQAVRTFVADRDALKKAAAASAALGRSDAAVKIADTLYALAGRT